jgi:hypothetical protein
LDCFIHCVHIASLMFRSICDLAHRSASSRLPFVPAQSSTCPRMLL